MGVRRREDGEMGREGEEETAKNYRDEWMEREGLPQSMGRGKAELT